MKKIAYALMFLFVFCFFNFYSNAQSPCSAVSVEVIESSSQSGQYKNWGIRVFIAQPYYDDITVEGTIEGGYAALWTLTIPAGNTSAQTSDNYYQTDPVTTAVATITNVSACPTSNGYNFFENFLASYDLQILNSSDSTQAINYMINRNSEIITYLSQEHPLTYNSNEIETDDVTIVWAGIIHGYAVANGYFSNGNTFRKKFKSFDLTTSLSATFASNRDNVRFVRNVPNTYELYALDWNCVYSVIFGIVDIGSLVEDYVHLIKTKGSWSLVRGLIWRTVKRYAGWGAAVATVYEIGTNCF